MAIEIERKFIVRGDGWRAGVTASEHLRQGYLANGSQVSVRIRIIDDKAAKLTVKAAASRDGPALARAEFEYPVPVEDALSMLDLHVGRIVEKTRYMVPTGDGRMWEIDVFAGALEGLVIAEIELADAADPVELPDWIEREVTDDPQYGNLALALRD